jgi:hypothetical protein
LGRWASYYNLDCKRQVVGGSNPGRCANEYIVWLIFLCPIQKLSMTCFLCTHWFPHYLFVLVTLCAPIFIYYLNFLLAPCNMFNKLPCNLGMSKYLFIYLLFYTFVIMWGLCTCFPNCFSFKLYSHWYYEY